jgi:hypothetical protein
VRARYNAIARDCASMLHRFLRAPLKRAFWIDFANFSDRALYKNARTRYKRSRAL